MSLLEGFPDLSQGLPALFDERLEVPTEFSIGYAGGEGLESTSRRASKDQLEG